MKVTRSLARRCCFAFALAAGLGATVRADAVAVVDALGRQVVVPDASRIVSIGGAVTEILYALNLAERIVAIDTTSLYPAAARAKPNVGYMRQLSAEGVLGLNPTVVLASESAGPKDTISVLEAAAVPLVLVPEHHTGEGVIEKINIVAHATGTERQGACLAAAVRDDLEALQALRASIDRPMRVLFVLSFMNGRPMVAGRNTAADGIIKLAGGANAVEDYEGYKVISDEAIIAVAPDIVLTMERAGERLEAEKVFAHPAFQLTPAARHKRFVSMEGLYLLGFGPRTARAARDLAVELYPKLTAPPLPSQASAKAGACP